jgi:hypothetical protein
MLTSCLNGVIFLNKYEEIRDSEKYLLYKNKEFYKLEEDEL